MATPTSATDAAAATGDDAVVEVDLTAEEETLGFNPFGSSMEDNSNSNTNKNNDISLPGLSPNIDSIASSGLATDSVMSSGGSGILIDDSTAQSASVPGLSGRSASAG